MQGLVLLCLVSWSGLFRGPCLFDASEKSVRHLRSKPYFHGGNGSIMLSASSSALKINEDGKINTYYLPGAEVIDDGMTVKYTPPYRFYLMKTDTTDYGNSQNYYQPILPGKIFEVDIDYG